MPFSPTEDPVHEMYAVVKAGWDAGSGTSGLFLGFEGVNKTRPKDGASWGWTSFRHARGRQSTFGKRTAQRYTHVGVLQVEIYASLADGLTSARALARIVEESLKRERTPGGAVFTNVGQQEIGPDGTWFHINVVADAEYDVVAP